jgi:hypothetical protein
MRNLAAIKVKILKNQETNQHQYPDFSQLEVIKNSGTDWQRYIDIFGLGWHYDKVCGHYEDEQDSPYGMQWGVLIVPKEFAVQAVAEFPALVFNMTEDDLKTFYNERAHAQEPDELVSIEVLDAIKTKQDLGLVLTAQQNKALDPGDDTPGIRKNKRRYWADYKILVGAKIV